MLRGANRGSSQPGGLGVPARRRPAAARITRASTATRPSSLAITGLTSISAMSGRDSISPQGPPMAISARTSAARFTRRRPLAPASNGAPRNSVQHGGRVGLGDRAEPEGDALQHLHEHAAEPDHDSRAELLVAQAADDDFRPAGPSPRRGTCRRGRRRWRKGCASPRSPRRRRRRPAAPSRTPPASLLCRMSWDTTFTANGGRKCRPSRGASPDRTTTDRGTANPTDLSRRLASGSLHDPLPAAVVIASGLNS